MKKNEFVRYAIQQTWDELDCWELCCEYYKDVLNYQLPIRPEEKHKNLHGWKNLPWALEHAIVLCYKGDMPVHMGIYLGEQGVLHARKGSYAQVNSLYSLAMTYTKLEYYSYGVDDADFL